MLTDRFRRAAHGVCRPLCGLSLLILLIGSVAVPAADTVKRPLTHADYDSWRTISSQTLSRDGRYLAYFVMPEEGDGEIVVRNLVTGKEWRHARGGRNPAAPAETGAPPNVAAAARGVRPFFTADGRFLVFNSAPTKTETDAAKAAKKKADEMPRAGIGVMDLASGHVTTTERVRSFQVPEDGSSWIAYSMEPKTEAGAGQHCRAQPQAQAAVPGSSGQGEPTEPAARPARQARRHGQSARPDVGSDLILRLVDGKQRLFKDVNDYTFTKDGKLLVYSTIAKDVTANGLFAVPAGTATASLRLLGGKGKFAKMTWDEKQTQLVFLSDRDTAGAKQPTWKLYYWSRKPAEEVARLAEFESIVLPAFTLAACRMAGVLPLLQAPRLDAATEMIGADLPNCKPGLVLSDRGAITFSQDGSRIFFGLATPTPPTPERAQPATEAERPTATATAAPTEERVTLDLWHWKDDFIQPMQKLRAGQERNRTLRAVLHLRDRKLVQLADENVRDVNPVGDGEWALGTDDRPYRILVGQDTNYVDDYLVNTWDGTRKPLLKKHQGALFFSPSARTPCLTAPTGRPQSRGRRRSTDAQPCAFHNETTYPSQPPWGRFGPDGKYC